MPTEESKISVKESYIIKKYHGDAPKEGEVKEPVEVIIVYSDGTIEQKVK